MANKSSIFKVRIDMANIDQHRYEQLCFTVAMSANESYQHFVMRLLAYAMVPEQRIAFGQGVCNGNDPDVMVKDYDEHYIYWIDVGYPQSARVKKACNQADNVIIFSLKQSDWLTRNQFEIMAYNNVQMVLLEPKLIEPLEQSLTRTLNWSLVLDGNKIAVCDHHNYWESSITRLNSVAELAVKA